MGHNSRKDVMGVINWTPYDHCWSNGEMELNTHCFVIWIFVLNQLLLSRLCAITVKCDCRSYILREQSDRYFTVGETRRPGWWNVYCSVFTYSRETSRFSSAVVMARREHHPQQGGSSEATWRYCCCRQEYRNSSCSCSSVIMMTTMIIHIFVQFTLCKGVR